MAATIRIKRRAAGGAAGAPATLAAAELAFNEQDNTLFYGKGDNGTGIATSVIAIAGPGTFPAVGTGNTWTGANNFNGNVTLAGTTAVTGTINFAGSTIQNLPLDSLTDVNLGKTVALATGQMLSWDGTDWVNAPAPTAGGGGTLTGVTATAGSGFSVSTVGGVVTLAGVDATSGVKGVTRYATAAEITAGTAGVAVDAAQLLAAAYTLPTATGTVLGGIKVGTNLSIDAAGVLSAAIPGAMKYKGTSDVTGAAPTGAAQGDVYLNTTTGVADASWVSVGGHTVPKDALLIFAGADWHTADLSSASVTAVTASLPMRVDNTDPARPGITIDAATVLANGVVRLADATAIAGGTAGRVVDAAQLKAVNDRLPAGTADDEMLMWDTGNSRWEVSGVIDCGTF